ncbi:MAG: hypothetical protein SGARI_005427, partial [Bacillariaceae sp.]
MKLSAVTLAAVTTSLSSVDAFCPRPSVSSEAVRNSLNMGYLDDLLGPGPPVEEEEDDSRDATKMAKEDLDRAGPGSWDSFVEFNEFDGGDGQMGVAGDGSGSKLEKFDMSEMAKSKSMSAKNAWGKATGYADTLVEQGVDTARAQQLENWHNQQEVLAQRKGQRALTDDFDKPADEDENWRNLASFGVERNQEFDLDETFGQVTADADLEGTIEL